jgi:cyclophilin family peptidyl-prolyl cis-trans isomerase
MKSMRSLVFVYVMVILGLSVACVTSPTPTQVVTPTVIGLADSTMTIGASTPTPQIARASDRIYKQYGEPPQLTIDQNSSYVATFDTSKGEMIAELFVLDAPNTVNNFVFLAQDGFYDGLSFHRVVKDFVIQGGDPRGDGSGGPGYRFLDEPVTRPYVKGVLAMANAGPNTNGSQFFIVHGAEISLQPTFTIFGMLTDGVDTLDALANTLVTAGPRGEVSQPLEQLVIEEITITKFE